MKAALFDLTPSNGRLIKRPTKQRNTKTYELMIPLKRLKYLDEGHREYITAKEGYTEQMKRLHELGDECLVQCIQNQWEAEGKPSDNDYDSNDLFDEYGNVKPY